MLIRRAHVIQPSRSFTWLFASGTDAWEGYNRLMNFIYPRGIFDPEAEDAKLDIQCVLDEPARFITLNFDVSPEVAHG